MLDICFDSCSIIGDNKCMILCSLNRFCISCTQAPNKTISNLNASLQF